MDDLRNSLLTEGGGKRGDSFYDVYSKLEVEARAFSVLQCQQKTASFAAYDLHNS